MAPPDKPENLLGSEHWHAFQVLSIDAIFLEYFTVVTQVYLLQPQSDILAMDIIYRVKLDNHLPPPLSQSNNITRIAHITYKRPFSQVLLKQRDFKKSMGLEMRSPTNRSTQERSGFKYLDSPDEKVKRLRRLSFAHLPNTVYAENQTAVRSECCDFNQWSWYYPRIKNRRPRSNKTLTLELTRQQKRAQLCKESKNERTKIKVILRFPFQSSKSQQPDMDIGKNIKKRNRKNKKKFKVYFL